MAKAAKKVVQKINPVIKTFMLIMFILLLITSIIAFLYGLGLMIQYFIITKAIKDMTNTYIFGIPLTKVKVRFALSMTFGFIGIIVFSVLLQKFFK